jgi:TNF receptor-associated protein 1
MFLKEGACHDASRRTEVAKLLYFDSSKDGGLTSLDEYVSRDSSDDEKIYYLHAPTRELALASPYYEQFKKNKRECLFVYNAIDDFVMSNIREHNGRQIVTAEAADFGGPDEEEEDKDDEAPSGNALSTSDADALKAWLLTTLPDRLESVEATDKLVSSPAVVVDAESGAMRRMMAMVAQQADGGALPPLPPQKLRLNVSHPVVVALAKASSVDEVRATAAAHQLLDNAIVAAGLMDDPRTMLPRLNKLLELALKVESQPVETEPLSRTDALEKGAARKEASEAMDK